MSGTHKAVLWDLDGTILDSITVMADILKNILPVIGKQPLDRKYIQSEFHGKLEDFLIRVTDGYHDQQKLLNLFFEEQLKHYENPVTHEGIRDAVEYFASKGLRQGIVTSRANQKRDSAGAHEIIKTLKMNMHIPVVISAEETKFHKPHPQPILMALEKLKVSPDHAVMIGDQLVDIQAAQAAGVASILVDYEGTADIRSETEGHPTDICANASEIIKAVNKILKV